MKVLAVAKNGDSRTVECDFLIVEDTITAFRRDPDNPGGNRIVDTFDPDEWEFLTRVKEDT